MKVLVVGGCGYIGTRLTEYLESFNYKVDIWDIEWFGNPAQLKNTINDARKLDNSITKDYDAVVLLAGHSSVQMCENNLYSAFNNNVGVFMHLNEIMHDNQKLIYASSSSVYGCRTGVALESDPLDKPVNPYDHTKQIIDNLNTDSIQHYKGLARPVALEPSAWSSSSHLLFGLRFGTVCGFSQNFRSDVMINAMYSNAKQNGVVNVFNGDTRRTILGITDCCRAIENIIRTGKESKIYNLGSVDSTSIDIGQQVAEQLGVECVETVAHKPGNAKMTTKNYDFWIDSSEFCKDFDFAFTDTIQSIVEDIQFGMSQAKLQGKKVKISPRSKHIEYETTRL